MDRMIETTISGVRRYLCYSIAVMFDMADKYGDISKALEIIQDNSREAFEAVQWFAMRMANEGELCRRDEGYYPQPMVTETEVSMRMAPSEFATLREAVVDAISVGYRREVEDSTEEKDLGLEELNAKKTKAGV